MPHLFTQDKTRLYYKDWGKGRPVVLIHGWPLNADTLDQIAMELAGKGHRVIAYDRRGFGRSEQAWTGYNYETLTDDLKSVIDELKLDDVALVGFSMGGGEVARYMDKYHGEKVSATALISSTVPYLLRTNDNPNGVDQDVFNEMAEGLRKDRPGFFGDFFKNFYGNSAMSKNVGEETLEWSRQIAMQASLKGTIDCVHAFGTTDLRSSLKHFQVPTLIIHGEDDKIVPIDVSSKQAAEHIKSSQLITYDDGPHGLLATHGERLAKDLLEFLTQQV